MKRHQRIKAVKFYREAKLHHAILVDIWKDGALLKGNAGSIPKVCEGKTGEYYLATRHGKTKFRGITKVVSHVKDELCWEVEFIELSPHKEDPLRRMIDEIVGQDSGLDGVADQQANE